MKLNISFLMCFRIVSGSLPPSPADSGVSDVDSSSSGHTSTDELKARLQPSIHSPVGNLFSRHPLSWSSSSHHNQRASNHTPQQFYQHFHTSEYLCHLCKVFELARSPIFRNKFDSNFTNLFYMTFFVNFSLVISFFHFLI